MAKLRKLEDVVSWRLCLGCGACAWACPEQKVRLYDFVDEGIRPVVYGHACESCRDCLAVCPVVESIFFTEAELEVNCKTDRHLGKEWGPITGIWEGYATEPETRFRGASGGVLTALAAYALEVLGMHGVLHSAQDPADPIRNRTRLSRTRAELLTATGSRYSPASVCNGLGLVEKAPAPCVIIGKPVEIAALRNAMKIRPGLAQKVGLTLSFFCAESPSTRGTLKLLERMGIQPDSVTSLRYRGNGWPGHFVATVRGHAGPCAQISYRESWRFLQAFRSWAANLWPDGTGELADISCGDPWYVEPDGQNPGLSLVVARTSWGREVVERACRAGYLTLQSAEPWKLVRSQKGLLQKKGAVWGRRLALRLMGLPVTRFRGLDLFHCWRLLPAGQKLRSVFGTWRRILQRRLYRPLRLDPTQAHPVPALLVVPPDRRSEEHSPDYRFMPSAKVSGKTPSG